VVAAHSAFTRLREALAESSERSEDQRLRVANSTKGNLIAHSVEIAGSGGARSKGLLGRISLAAGAGLWIVPCEAVHTFWMKFPIDLIYLDREFRIRKLSRDVPAWRISMCFAAHSVLELAAGTIRDSQAQTGDVLEMVLAEPHAANPSPADAGNRIDDLGSTCR
jgi:uncharacterized protein